MAVAFVFLGPAPWIPMEPTVNLIFGITVLVGVGYAMIAVSTFSRVLQAALKRGFAGNIATYMVISGGLT